MDLGLEGKVALVTAASEGLGFACAERLAKATCKMAICGRRPDVLAAAREELLKDGAGDVLAVPTDLADSGAIDDLVKRGQAVSAKFVIPYPPGFPIMVPGQVITAETITFMRKLDVKEIHGYQAALGLELIKPEKLGGGKRKARR